MRYKLRMLGFKIAGPTIRYEDNQNMVISATNPSSTLKKKHNVLAYYKTRESIAACIVDFSFIRSKVNGDDMFSKVLSKR